MSFVLYLLTAAEDATPEATPAMTPPTGVVATVNPTPQAAVAIVADVDARNSLNFLTLQLGQPWVALSAVPVTSLPSLRNSTDLSSGRKAAMPVRSTRKDAVRGILMTTEL